MPLQEPNSLKAQAGSEPGDQADMRDLCAAFHHTSRWPIAEPLAPVPAGDAQCSLSPAWDLPPAAHLAVSCWSTQSTQPARALKVTAQTSGVHLEHGKLRCRVCTLSAASSKVHMVVCRQGTACWARSGRPWPPAYRAWPLPSRPMPRQAQPQEGPWHEKSSPRYCPAAAEQPTAKRHLALGSSALHRDWLRAARKKSESKMED